MRLRLKAALSGTLAVTFLSVVAVVAAAPVAQDEPPASAGVVIKRRSDLTDEELRKELKRVPDVGLDQGGAATLYTLIQKPQQQPRRVSPARPREMGEVPPAVGPMFLRQVLIQTKQSHLFALPWIAGEDCEMGKEAAEQLHVISTNLRAYMRQAVPSGDVRPDAEALKSLIRTGAVKRGLSGRGRPGIAGQSLNPAEWKKPSAVPALVQMLQAENAPLRVLLIDLLADIDGRAASQAIAARAVFDLSSDVRDKAVQALARRPLKEYGGVMAYGLRHPWPAAADHAAEAVAALKLTALLPRLVEMLKEPAPTVPFQMTVKDAKVYVVKELVRINHLSNCMVCHAPSHAKDDLVRGRVPMPGEDPPPLYYAERTGYFVRADITYLRQDFSVIQPVLKAGKWPGNQRYDYVLRTRQLTKSELSTFRQLEKDGKLPKVYAQRDAVLFALRQLARTDVGESYRAWHDALPKLQKVLRQEP